MKILTTIIVFSLILVLSGCQNSSPSQSSADSKNSQMQSSIKQISVEKTKEAVDGQNVQFIDVRTIEEYQAGHAPKTLNLPLDKLEQTLAKLDKSKPVYVICQTGRRSQKGAEILENNGSPISSMSRAALLLGKVQDFQLKNKTDD